MEDKLKLQFKKLFSDSQDIINSVDEKFKEVQRKLDEMEERYLGKLCFQTSKKPRKTISYKSTRKTTEQELPADATFVVSDTLDKTVKNDLNEKFKINNNVLETAKKAVRVKKGNGEGTPVTSKSEGSRASVSVGVKKKLMDVTNTKNDSHDETFKIPGPKPLKSGKKLFSFDDVSEAENSDAEEVSYPSWCKHIGKSFEKQRYVNEVLGIMFSSGPIDFDNPAEIFPDSNSETFVRSRSSIWAKFDANNFSRSRKVL